MDTLTAFSVLLKEKQVAVLPFDDYDSDDDDGFAEILPVPAASRVSKRVTKQERPKRCMIDPWLEKDNEITLKAGGTKSSFTWLVEIKNRLHTKRDKAFRNVR
eukprot:TRINITY_DN50321_c0_g1_i1.p1 TRINITY_DN50321_c0_g1~~TRINITY_DN50321_c0_g1_i1.p1  ORF type:complete len:121 (+),score=27.22 TRINITY_DN50321_c0_g1_i1:57-365(+)